MLITHTGFSYSSDDVTLLYINHIKTPISLLNFEINFDLLNYSIKETRYVPYTETYVKRKLGIKYGTGVRTNYKTEVSSATTFSSTKS